jgi:4-oxalocrotonate tautomerase
MQRINGGDKMPSVHVYWWAGRDTQTKKDVIAGMTKVFMDMDIPANAVEVIIHDVPKENWGIGGRPATEKFDH